MISAVQSAAPAAGFARTPAAAGNSGRNPALDFTKGALVLCMIVYHTLNYFRYDPNLLRHLHFLPPSFIFIAGFLITHLYLPKFRAGDRTVPRRLFVRGLKTLALFIALNLAVHSLFEASYNRNLGLDFFFSHLDVVFLTGEQRASVFGVLLPISYVLLISALLLRVSALVPLALQVAAATMFLVCLVLAHQGRLVFNLDLVSMGLFGAVVGLVDRRQLDRVAWWLVPISIAYLGYSVAVRFQYPTYLMNIAGICLSLLLFYGIGLRWRESGIVTTNIRLLGNYSLLSYLIQIAVLQFLFRLFRYFDLLAGDVIVPLLATTALTLLCVKLVDLARARAASIDRSYKAVFA